MNESEIADYRWLVPLETSDELPPIDRVFGHHKPAPIDVLAWVRNHDGEAIG